MATTMNLPEETEKLTGRTLSEKWDVQVAHALYREDGMWYHVLRRFPGALFDRNGYIRFETRKEFLNYPGIHIESGTNQVHVRQGISKLKDYVRMTDVVQNDEDTEEEFDEGFEPITISEYGEIDVREDNHSVFEWARKLDRDLIITDPDFQRNVVWKPSQKSQFIESILLNIPLPPIYVNQNVQGKYILVDGLQRTTTLHEFITGAFSLSGLRILKHLNGRSFAQLDAALQTKIEDRKLFIFVIKPSASITAVYDIFYRINTGGTQLNRQEIRNCLYAGASTRLLKALAKSSEFVKATDGGFSPKRMKDCEAVLRCLAFANFDFEQNYTGHMDEYLGEIMKSINKRSGDDDYFEMLRSQFTEVMLQTFDIFGTDNFRPVSEDGRGRINIALMESVYRFFASHLAARIPLPPKEKLLRSYQRLCRDPEFINAIQRATGGRQRVLARFQIAMKTLGER